MGALYMKELAIASAAGAGHSSTAHLNLSRYYHWNSMLQRIVSLHKMLTSSRNVDEVHPSCLPRQVPHHPFGASTCPLSSSTCAVLSLESHNVTHTTCLRHDEKWTSVRPWSAAALGTHSPKKGEGDHKKK